MRMTGWAAACVLLLTVACSDSSRRNNDTSSPAATASRDDGSAYGSGNLDNRDTSEAIGTSGQAPRAGDNDARQFAQQAMMANYAEAKLGELAKDHAQNAA